MQIYRRKENNQLDCWHANTADHKFAISAVQRAIPHNYVIENTPVERWKCGVVLALIPKTENI